MANIDQIRSLNNKYNKKSPITEANEIGFLNESFDPNKIEKAFTDSIANLGPVYLRYFELGLPADVVLIFVDVCGFSTKYIDYTGDQITEYFDNYYNLIIPFIYDCGGEIDKIIGDGIIAVFGPPFSDLTLKENITRANKCSRAIIKATTNTKFESKVAIHSGIINYFKNKSGLYSEYTMIGRTLTELFRLETISENNCINYYKDTAIASFYEEGRQPKQIVTSPTNYIPWKLAHKPIENLKGVDYTQLFYIKYQPVKN